MQPLIYVPASLLIGMFKIEERLLQASIQHVRDETQTVILVRGRADCDRGKGEGVSGLVHLREGRGGTQQLAEAGVHGVGEAEDKAGIETAPKPVPSSHVALYFTSVCVCVCNTRQTARPGS